MKNKIKKLSKFGFNMLVFFTIMGLAEHDDKVKVKKKKKEKPHLTWDYKDVIIGFLLFVTIMVVIVRGPMEKILTRTMVLQFTAVLLIAIYYRNEWKESEKIIKRYAKDVQPAKRKLGKNKKR